MTNEEYIKRIADADGDYEKMFVAQGERMGTLHAQTQTELIHLRGEVKALCAEVKALREELSQVREAGK